jgi:hypothetical protein
MYMAALNDSQDASVYWAQELTSTAQVDGTLRLEEPLGTMIDSELVINMGLGVFDRASLLAIAVVIFMSCYVLGNPLPLDVATGATIVTSLLLLGGYLLAVRIIIGIPVVLLVLGGYMLLALRLDAPGRFQIDRLTTGVPNAPTQLGLICMRLVLLFAAFSATLPQTAPIRNNVGLAGLGLILIIFVLRGGLEPATSDDSDDSEKKRPDYDMKSD